MKLKEHLEKEIEKTGYPVEMEISTLLDEGNWIVLWNDYYFDYDQNVAREIDIRATPLKPQKEAKQEKDIFSCYPFLAIECKKSESYAWVFFKRKLKLGRFGFEGQYLDYINAWNIEERFYPVYLTLLGKLHYYRSKEFSRAYKQIKLQKDRASSKDEIFEAINQLLKYVSYEIENYIDVYKNGLMKIMSNVFFLPIIVFDGKLYESVLEDKRLSLKRSNHTTVLSFYRSRYAPHRFPFFIDVVQRNYFPKFLRLIEKEIVLITEDIKSHKRIQQEFLEALEKIGRKVSED